MKRDPRTGRAASMKISASCFADSSYHEKNYGLLPILIKVKISMGKNGDKWR
jgi:hypothetical protein